MAGDWEKDMPARPGPINLAMGPGSMDHGPVGTMAKQALDAAKERARAGERKAALFGRE